MKSWWFRMKPRSILRTIEWFPSFAKLEGRDWNKKDEIKISARTGKAIRESVSRPLHEKRGTLPEARAGTPGELQSDPHPRGNLHLRRDHERPDVGLISST